MSGAVAAQWWTPADEAELDVLVSAFVDGFYDHRDRCRVCAGGGPWCEHATEGWHALAAWRRTRGLLSRAEWLRRQHDELALILDGDVEKARAA